MIRFLFSVALIAALPLAALAYPPAKGASKDCMECHKVDKKELDVLIRKLSPALSVVDVKLAPVKGLWQVEIDSGEGKRGALFLDFAKKHILVLNQLIPVEAIGKPRKIDFSKLLLKEAMVLGAETAKVKVAVFTDPDCPYCRKLHDEMKLAIEKRRDIAFYLFLYPLPMHKDAYKKSQAILCEKSLNLLDDAFAGKAIPEPACGNERVEKIVALGRELKFEGTPTLIREDGTVLSGYLNADKLIDWIDGK
jgi:thiol:disulfide interchange protein DsbC